MQNKIIESCSKSIEKTNFIYLNENEFPLLNDKIISEILDKFGGKYLIRLPESEISFFEWLKINDYNVWQDIWLNDTVDNNCDEIYLVSVNLLPVFMNLDGRGLPICDLQNTENYFFTMAQMVDEESKLMIEATQELFRNHKPLTVAQMLALEISLDPIDIWHFAYKHKIDLEQAKEAVKTLVEDNALVHLKEAEYIVPFIHF